MARRLLAVGGLGSHFGLCSIPQIVEFGEGHVAKLDVSLASHPLDTAEAVTELVGRGSQGALGLDAVAAGEIGNDQQEVADFLGDTLLWRGSEPRLRPIG